MNKKIIIGIVGFVFVLVLTLVLVINKDNSAKEKEITGTVLKLDGDEITIQDSNNVIYTFGININDIDLGDNLLIKYTGLIDKNSDYQSCEVLSYKFVNAETDSNGIPKNWLDNGIFSKYYILAYDKLKTLSLEEKIGQLLLVRYPDSNPVSDLKKYKFSGFVFYEKDFKDKTIKQVQNMMETLQNNANIPLLTAVDEEGGKVVRVSSNSSLVSSKFKSPSELYSEGGFSKIKENTINKSKILYNLGLNLNLAPVVDVSTNPDDYMYDRTLQEDTELTSTYAKTVIEASKGTNVSYTLKHFPGYGSDADTHTGASTDTRSYNDILTNDIPPFEAGIKAGAEAVLMSHNIVNSIDSENPASLSTKVHNLLRNELNFTGIIITDDIGMQAVSSIDDVAIKAVLAGNDLIITTDYQESFNSIKAAVNNGTISEEQIDKLAFRVLAWKYYKGLLFDAK